MRKLIYSTEDLDIFRESSIYGELVEYLETLSNSLIGTTCKISTPSSNKGITLIRDYLDQLEICIAHFLAKDDAKVKSRFGNVVFRQWLDMVAITIKPIVRNLVGVTYNDETIGQNSYMVNCMCDAIISRKYENQDITEPSKLTIEDELCYFFRSSFGDRERVDFGTGHELNFLVFLFLLSKQKKHVIFLDTDMKSLVVEVFFRYTRLTHALQRSFWLEPAGSHGVWGLDDYAFLPFYFGSAQLIGHPNLKPSSILYRETLQVFSQEYFYFYCIQNINQIKNVALSMHSPMLYDITSVKTWDKVNEGLLKMYKVEVLNKLPIMQHLLFGETFNFKLPENRIKDGNSGVKKTVYNHDHKSCCVNRIPSAISAQNYPSLQKKISLIPFD